jgi:hypothetical protein
VFSGAPDPTWPLADGDVAVLERIWNSLAPANGDPAVAPPLGYRGCFAVDATGGRRFDAYGGTVTLDLTGAREARRDPPRTFERCVLETAPGGVLPPDAIDRW